MEKISKDFTRGIVGKKLIINQVTIADNKDCFSFTFCFIPLRQSLQLTSHKTKSTLQLNFLLLIFCLSSTSAFGQGKTEQTTSRCLFDKVEEYQIDYVNDKLKVYGESTITNFDKIKFLLSIPEQVDPDQTIFYISSLSFYVKMTVLYKGRVQKTSEYSTKLGEADARLNADMDMYDSSLGKLIGEKVRVSINKKDNLLVVENADSIYSKLPNILGGYHEIIKTYYFSNDFLRGMLLTFFQTGVKAHDTVGRTWTHLQENESLIIPNLADKKYCVLSTNKDSLVLGVNGTSIYRTPDWSSQYESRSYCTGTVDGILNFKPGECVPESARFNYQFKIAKTMYTTTDEIIKSKVEFLVRKVKGF